MRYSGLQVLAQGLTGNRGWRPAWRDPAPKDEYDIVIIGGGFGTGQQSVVGTADAVGGQGIIVDAVLIGIFIGCFIRAIADR